MHKINKETPLVLNVARSRSQGGVDDSDKELFILMKSIVDADFPPATEPMLLALYKRCWEEKRKIRYRETKNGSIIIDFPKMNPLLRLFGEIALRFTRG